MTSFHILMIVKAFSKQVSDTVLPYPYPNLWVERDLLFFVLLLFFLDFLPFPLFFFDLLLFFLDFLPFPLDFLPFLLPFLPFLAFLPFFLLLASASGLLTSRELARSSVRLASSSRSQAAAMAAMARTPRRSRQSLFIFVRLY